ncbi:hypothetical protein M3Y97_00611800 [Aphelenchoides bicaudatus]|nr:hypothetical protein M3Y97_00611800 [Aphelenchoides bicaudatus]
MRLFVLSTLFIVSTTAALPQPKPIVASANAEVYQKQQCGPFLETLSKKNAERLRRILDQEDMSKKDIDNDVEQFVAGLDKEAQDRYASFKRALKVRLLRIKLRHELKMKTMSDEAKRLDEKIQAVIEDKELTWPETLKAKNDLIRKAKPRILKELGIKPPVEESEEKHEDSAEEDGHDQHGFDYEHNNGGAGKYDYHQTGGHTPFNEDYTENSHFGHEDGMRKGGTKGNNHRGRPTSGRTRAEEAQDYHQDEDNDH